MEEVPSELDWVKERAKCDIKTAYADLLQAVQRDAEDYDKISNQHMSSQISVNEQQGLGFTVSRQNKPSRTVIFALHSEEIEITLGVSNDSFKLIAVPILTKSGRCKFNIGDEQLEQWQLRRLALEDLLFGKSWG